MKRSMSRAKSILSFIYRKSEWKYTVSGLEISRSYVLTKKTEYILFHGRVFYQMVNWVERSFIFLAWSFHWLLKNLHYPMAYPTGPVTLEMTVYFHFQSLVSSPKSIQKQMKPKDAQKKRADIRLLICSVTICTIFMLLFLPSVLINVIKVTGSSLKINRKYSQNDSKFALNDRT